MIPIHRFLLAEQRLHFPRQQLGLHEDDGDVYPIRQIQMYVMS